MGIYTLGTFSFDNLPFRAKVRRSDSFQLKPCLWYCNNEQTLYDKDEEYGFHFFTNVTFVQETHIHFLWWTVCIGHNIKPTGEFVKKGDFVEKSLFPPELDPNVTPPTPPPSRKELFKQFYGREPEEGELENLFPDGGKKQ